MKPLVLNAVTISLAVACFSLGDDAVLNFEKLITGIEKPPDVVVEYERAKSCGRKRTNMTISQQKRLGATDNGTRNEFQ